MNALDTNVFAYALDATDPAKQTRARAFIDGIFASAEPAIIPWQVAVELLACLRKWESAGKITRDNAQSRFTEFLDVWTLAMPTVNVFQVSFQLRENHSLSHWDSLLVAACKEASVTHLYSEDMQDGADYDGVRIINPFA